MDDFWKSLVKTNSAGLAAGIHRLLKHTGTINYTQLSRVSFRPDGDPRIERGIPRASPHAHLSIMIGGEIANSFTPLYEFSYFAQALLLSATYTVAIDSLCKTSTLSEIESCLVNLSEAEIIGAIRSPAVSIVSNLDTDIEPCRYAKEQLWRIPAQKLKNRCTEILIKGKDFGISNEKIHEKNPYFGDVDESIAVTAIKHAASLPEAKEIQFALSLRRCLRLVGIDLENIPFYFHLVPKEELVNAGSSTIFLDAILEMHTRPSLNYYSDIVKRRQPWIIGKNCPNCGETSKRIINYRLKNYGKTVRCTCSAIESSFYREDGVGITRKGCGEVFEFEVPNTREALYDFICVESFTINFPVRDILGVILDTVYQPAIWIVTDIGVARNTNGQMISQAQPTGFGDHRQMVTSTVEVHDLFLKKIIAPQTAQKASENLKLVNAPVEIFGNTSPVKFTHPTLLTPDKRNHVTDTSVNLLINSEVDMFDAFLAACDFNHFPLDLLSKIKDD